MEELTPALIQARTRSVDNLQRLFTVVVSLAVTESLRRIMSDSMHSDVSTHPGADTWLMFGALMATIIPFYHGANRYLDSAYVTGERRTPHPALMVDFIVLFCEGLVFFGLAMLVGNERNFYTLLSILLIVDAVWVGFTRLISIHELSPTYRKWATVNVVTALCLLTVVWSNMFDATYWKTDQAASIAAFAFAALRTILDYSLVWSFYYPVGQIPAPPPAMAANEAGS